MHSNARTFARPSARNGLIIALLALPALSVATAQTGAELLGDINSTGDPAAGFAGFRESAAAGNGTYFFSASDGLHGFEPWVIDTATGDSQMLVDIHPGSRSSDPNRFTASGSQVFFTANEPSFGAEL